MLQACATHIDREANTASQQGEIVEKPSTSSVSSSESNTSNVVSTSATAPQITQPTPFIQRGSGRFINESVASQRVAHSLTKEGDINLQFNGTELSEVVRTIFGELLKQAYVISPKVGGRVTFSTAKPIAKSQLRYVLEMILGWNSAALVLREDIFHIIPIAEAVPGQLSPNIGTLIEQPGYEVQIVPLKYVSATEMTTLLKPFLTNQALLHADDARSFLVLAGTVDQLKSYQRTIDIFDVDWLAGMSIGMFPLRVSDPIEIVDELKTILGDDKNPLAEKIQLLPMQRLNSIVVMTPLPEYLDKIRDWIERLDRQAGESIEQRLFVYSAKNMDAEKLADVLSELFSDAKNPKNQTTLRNRPATIPPPKKGAVAPGLTAVELSENGVRTSQASTTPTQSVRATGEVNFGEFQAQPISITAVEENNALLIKASAKQYQAIQEAIKLLDIVPLQVVIQVNIMEVSLTDGLSYGVEWFLNNTVGDFVANNNAGGNGSIRLGSAGLSYLIGRNNTGIAISALENSGKAKLLSSPSLWALNNESASINVGTQIPVNTTSINTGGNTDVITSNVQFRDTGVIFDVTPRIQPEGLVYLDVKLTISNPTGGSDSNGNVSVAQRALETKVAVNNGETIMLGGLISENNSSGRNGVPWLSQVPLLKHFFSSNSNDFSRTEIIAIITPTVIYNQANAKEIMADYQEQLQYIYPVSPLENTLPQGKNSER